MNENGDLPSERESERLLESRYLQNRMYSRDQLSDPVSVKHYYFQLKQAQCALDFDEIGVGVFSQNNEDGILLGIFSQIGMPIKRSVEIGCDLSGSTVGIPEGNSINLIVNFAFDGLIVDMDPGKVGAMRHFFAHALSTKHFHAPKAQRSDAYYYSPSVVAAEVTQKNIDTVLAEANFADEIDLFSIDIDGEDVLVWEALTIARPRVVVVEINNRLAFDIAHYGNRSNSLQPADSLDHQASYGSSLQAACEIAAKKGYVFVGMNSTLINAFFVRRDVWKPSLPERFPKGYIEHRLSPLRGRFGR